MYTRPQDEAAGFWIGLKPSTFTHSHRCSRIQCPPGKSVRPLLTTDICYQRKTYAELCYDNDSYMEIKFCIYVDLREVGTIHWG